MMRVRAHSYKKMGNVWTPFLHDGRQVQLVAQPGAQEAWLALPEQEGLFAVRAAPAKRSQPQPPICSTLAPATAHRGKAYGFGTR